LEKYFASVKVELWKAFASWGMGERAQTYVSSKRPELGDRAAEAEGGGEIEALLTAATEAHLVNLA